MKKRFAALLLAVMLLWGSCASALDWSCPLCGRDNHTLNCAWCGTIRPVGYYCSSCYSDHGDVLYAFCPSCGAAQDISGGGNVVMNSVPPASTATPTPSAMPTATPAPTATSTPIPKTPTPTPWQERTDAAVTPVILENVNGTVTVIWDADGVTRYRIRYIPKRSDDPWTDAMIENPDDSLFPQSYIGLYNLNMLVPGRSYWIGVFDAQDRGSYTAYEPGRVVQRFDRFQTSLYLWPLVRQNGEDVEIDVFDGRDIASASGVECGLFLAVRYDNPGEEYKPMLQVAVEAPGGFTQVIFAADASFRAGAGDVTGWTFFPLEDYARRMEQRFGSVPEGTYWVSVFLDGQLVDTMPFTVGKASAATPTQRPTAAPTWIPTVAPTRMLTATPTQRPTAVPTPTPTATPFWIPTAAPTTAPTAVPTRVPTPTPTAVPAKAGVKFANLLTKEDGSLLVSWVGGEAPYKVRYVVKRSESYEDDVANPNGTGRWLFTDRCMDTYCTVNDLIPGWAYWISVLDASGEGRVIAYEPDPVKRFDDFDVNLEIIPRSRVGETLTDLSGLPLDIAGLEDDTEHGAYIYLDYDNPGAARKLRYTLVMTMPNGAALVDFDQVVEMGSGIGRSLGFSFYNAEWYLNFMRNRFGDLPQGDITVDIYLDGALAASGVIPLGEKKVDLPARSDSGITILSITENADGTATIIWSDTENNGPYEVNYVQKFSDDYMADRYAANSTGMWYDASEVYGTSHTLTYLVPGQAYWLAVHNADGQGVYEEYIPAQPKNFPEFTVKMSNQPKLQSSGGATNISQFSAARIALGTVGHGMYLKVDHPQLARPRDYRSVVAITAPNGSVIAVSVNDFHMNSGSQGYVYWNFFDLSWYFEQMLYCFDSVPVGTYTVNLYFDGEYAASTTFRVGN